MREADSESVHGGLDFSRIIFLVALALLVGYFAVVSSTNVTSPFVIVSGTSMEPTYHAGDLLLVESVVPAAIAEGDVIVFHTQRKGVSAGLPTRIAHRVVGIQPVDGMLGYLTRGDNSDRDNFVVSSNLLIGSVKMNLGPIGKLLAFVTNIKLLLIIGLPLAVVGGVFWLLTREDEEESENGIPTPATADPARPVRQVRELGTSQNSSFVSTYDNRMADRDTNDVKNWLLTNQPSPEVRKAFDDVTDRLDRLRAQRPTQGDNG
jgi:signal peptidase I